MADDKSDVGGRDRARVAGGQDYEVRHFAEQNGISIEQATKNRLAAVPAGRLGTPDEFGKLCAFVASAHAGYLTGQNFLIDGGAFRGTF